MYRWIVVVVGTLVLAACTTMPPMPSSEPLTDAEVEEALTVYLSGNAEEREAMSDRIVAADDTRFVAVYIELLYTNLVGLTVRDGGYVEALEALSGESFGSSWPDWIEWYGDTDLEPPPGYLDWKGRLYARIDREFADFLRDDVPIDLRPEEIVWGGVSVDGIPALDNAEMVSPAAADYLVPEEPVFGLEINGDARAYPLRIMDWHEMANDVVGGVPVSIAYCTLCGAAIAYDGRASDGTTYTFGSSGLLYRSNKLMYDRQTRTLWNQLTGEPVLGELVGVELDILPVTLTSWAEWQEQHPDTQVLALETGYGRNYELGAAYGSYFADEGTMFPVWQRSDLLEDKSQIFALRIDGTPKAYPLDTVLDERVINDELAGEPVVIVGEGDLLEVEGQDMRSGNNVTYTAGGEVRAYERGDHTFSPGDMPDTVIDEAGEVWQVTEQALVGPGGDLPRIGGHLAYWFGWFAFFPDTLVYGEEAS